MILWIAGPAMLLVAGAAGVAYVRRRRNAPAEAERSLTAEEEARLQDILKD